MRSLQLLAVSVALSACSFAARSPDMYRDDTGKVLATKHDEIRACYDTVLKASPGAQGTVTVNFEVETEQGKISNVTVDKAKTTAPDPVSSCVTKSIEGLSITPPDARKGAGMWVYEFSAPPPAAATPEKT